MRWTLRTLDIFSRVYRPSQTAHLLLFLPKKVSDTIKIGQCYIFASIAPERATSKAPAYTMQSRQYHNSRLQ